MTSTSSTESAWGPRDWSSHGGGAGWQELFADAASPQDLEQQPAQGAFEDRTFGNRAPDSRARHGGVPGDEAFGDAAPSGNEARDRRRPSRGGSRGRRRSPEKSASGERVDPSGEQVPTDPASRARDICLRLLTGQARTRRQLADALRRKDIPDEIAEQVLDRLTEVGLIDDAAYARSWVEQRQRSRGLARRALAGELRAKGVDSSLVAEAVAEVDPDDEEAAARRLVDRKLPATRGLDRQVRLRRLAGMLARRGYPEGLALRVVRSALDSEGEDGSEDDFLDSGEE